MSDPDRTGPSVGQFIVVTLTAMLLMVPLYFIVRNFPVPGSPDVIQQAPRPGSSTARAIENRKAGTQSAAASFAVRLARADQRGVTRPDLIRRVRTHTIAVPRNPHAAVALGWIHPSTYGSGYLVCIQGLDIAVIFDEDGRSVPIEASCADSVD